MRATRIYQKIHEKASRNYKPGMALQSGLHGRERGSEIAPEHAACVPRFAGSAREQEFNPRSALFAEEETHPARAGGEMNEKGANL